MAIQDDFEIQADGDIRHISGTTTYTVLELHRWLQDYADQAQASGDDFMDITTSTPSERSTDNIITLNAPFNIDDTAAQYLYDGSISQTNPVTSAEDIYAGLVVVGAVETGTELQVWQDEAILTSFWSTGLNADANQSILNRVLIKVKANGAQIDGQRIIVWARELGDTYSEFSVTMGLGNNVAAIFTSTDLNNGTAAATIATWSDVTNTEGYQLLDINSDTTNEEYYSQWDYGTRTASQVYERTKWIARRGSSEAIHSTTGPLFRGITHSFNYDGELATITEDSILAWGTAFAFDGGTGATLAVGDYVENTTQSGFGKVVYIDGTTTGTLVVQRESLTPAWANNDTIAKVSGTAGSVDVNVTINETAGGSGRVLALDDNGTSGTIWIQLMSGAAPADNYELYQRGASGKRADVAGASTVRTVSPEFLGTYTGSSIIGAYGIGIAPSDGIAADLFTPLVGSAVSPPNNQQFTVLGLVSGEDRVLVTNNSGGNIDFTQLTLNTSLLGATETAVVVTAAIPADTPTSGTIRVQLDSGVYREQAYTSWSGSTFTIASTDYSTLTATAPRNVFVAYIDKLAGATSENVTLKYSSDRTMFVRVRDGGGTPIKTFETTSVFGSGGGSATAVRTSDA